MSDVLWRGCFALCETRSPTKMTSLKYKTYRLSWWLQLLHYIVVQRGTSWLASLCPGRRLSTWQMIAASRPTALGALCGQLTFRLAWRREHSAVTATELLQPLDLACGTLFRFSGVIQTSPTDCSDDSWRDTFFGKHEHGWVTSDMWRLRKTLTYLLTYSEKKQYNTTSCSQTERRTVANLRETYSTMVSKKRVIWEMHAAI